MPQLAKQVLGQRPQRSFRHLLGAGRKGDQRPVPARLQSKEKYVQPKDRIPLWNIMSGDRVRVLAGAKKGKCGTVDYVDRERNRVYLAENEFARPKSVPTEKKNAIFNDPRARPNQTVLSALPIHYSNLALIVDSPYGETTTDKKGKKASTSDVPEPEVVAKRVRAVNVHFNWTKRKWEWQRMAEGVSAIDSKTGHLTSLDWDAEDRKKSFPYDPRKAPLAQYPSVRDATWEDATEATFVPAIDPISDRPRELGIRDIEFFNQHGRARRMKRYRERKEAEAAELNAQTQGLTIESKGSNDASPVLPKASPATASFLEA